MIRRRAIAVAAWLAALAAPASAQWLYQGEESAFGDRGSHKVITANDTYGFGFRCEETGSAAVYVTPEELSNSEAETLALGFPRLMIRVDDLPPHDLMGFVDSTQNRLRITATVDQPVVEQIRDAKKRVAVAIRKEDRVFHESSFGVRGSTAQVGKFLAACPFLPPAD